MCYWFPVQVNLVLSRQFRFRIWYHEWVLWFLWMLMMIDCWFLSALSYLSSFGLQRWSSSTVYEKEWVSQICWFQAWHLGLSPANLFRFAVLLSQRCRLFLDFGFETDHFDHFHFSVIFASNISDWNTQGMKEFSILVLHIWQGMVLARRSTGIGKCQSWRVYTERIWELNAFPLFLQGIHLQMRFLEMARICFEHPHQYKHTASPAQVSGCHWHCLAHSQLWISLPQNGLHSITSGGFLASSFQPHRDIQQASPMTNTSVVFAVGFFEVTSPDCGTEEGVPMPFKKRKPAEAGFADRIRGRVLAGHVLHPKDSSLLFKKG